MRRNRDACESPAGGHPDDEWDDFDRALEAFAWDPDVPLPATSADVLIELLERLERRWLGCDLTREEFSAWAYRVFRMDPDSPPNLPEIVVRYEQNLYQAKRLYYRFLAFEMVGEPDQQAEHMQRFSRILETIWSVNNYLQSEHRARALRKADYDVVVPDEVDIFRFSFIDFSLNNNYQNLLIYLLRVAHVRGYRRYREMCCEQITAEFDGRKWPTRAWKPVCTVKEFVYRSVEKEVNYQQWLNLTAAKDNARCAAEYLVQCYDGEFPRLQPDRHLFAFRNGLYYAVRNEWHPYDDTLRLPPDMCACKYHDSYFEAGEWMNLPDWYDIPTPNFDQILETQELPEEVRRWVFALLGRCIYDVGEGDGWQIIPFIKGVAGTGKSTIGKVLHSFYDASDVAVLSNNMEKKFGLSSIYDRLLFLCYEVKDDLGLNQADFQSMVSGEEVSVPIKHKTATTVVWKCPGLLMGNEIAAWVDAGGSITRRVIPVGFAKKVNHSDPQLFKKLACELAAIICKCNSAYLDYVQRWGKEEIWKILPDYFHKQQMALKSETSPLYAFITESDAVECRMDGYLPWTVFIELYREYCRSNSIQPRRLKKDVVNSIFSELGLCSVVQKLQWQGVYQTTQWVTGIAYRNQPSGPEPPENPAAGCAQSPAVDPRQQYSGRPATQIAVQS